MESGKLLSKQVCAEIDQWVTKYPEKQKQSAVMAALRLVQDDNGGHLSTELIAAVAQYLSMPGIDAHEVATFYSMYEHTPQGRHKFCVCTNISCMLSGSDEVLAHFNERLGIKPGETTKDGKISLKEVECLGACTGAPMLQLGRQYHEHLTTEKIDALLDSLE